MEKPPTITQKTWDNLDTKGKEFIINHERMHEEFRQCAARAAKNKEIDDRINAILAGGE